MCAKGWPGLSRELVLTWKNHSCVQARSPHRHGEVKPTEGQSCEPKGTAGASRVLSRRKQNLVREMGGSSR